MDAVVEYKQTYTASGGADTTAIEVGYLEITGLYST
jgi:hypothetical protein